MPGGVHAWGTCVPRGACMLGGVHAQRGACMPRGHLCLGGMHAWEACVPGGESMHASPVDRILDTRL